MYYASWFAKLAGRSIFSPLHVKYKVDQLKSTVKQLAHYNL